MAQYDGSIRIGTKIDISGIDKGYKEMAGAMGSVAQGLNNIVSSANKSADAVSKSAKKETESVEGLSESLTDVSKDIDNLNNKKIDIKIERHDDIPAEKDITEPKTKMVSADSLKYNKDAIRFIEEYAKKSEDSAKKSKTTLLSLISDTKKELKALGGSITKTTDKIASLRSKMDALKNTKIPTQEYKEISSQIAKAESEFNRLLEKQEQMQREGKDNGVAWERLNYKIDEVGNTIRYAKGELQDLIDSGKAFTLGSDTDKYAEMSTQMQQLNQQMQSDTKRQSELQSAIVEEEERLAKIRENAVVGNRRIVETLDRIKKLEQEISDLKKVGVTEGYKDYDDRISELSRLKQVVKDYNSGIEKTKKNYKKLGDVAKKALFPLMNVLKKATSSMLGFGKSTKKSNNVLQSSFKNILKYGLGIRSLYVLVNKIRNGIKEGFGNLSNENESFKNSVNSLKASLLTLKNAFAGAFAPIVQIAIPYIQQLIGWLTSAVEAVGQFIAALTGRKTYIKAVRQTAGAFEDAAGAANDAKEAAEGYLSPLDEINKYSDGKDKGAGAGGGGAGGAGQMFEEVPIESRFQELVDELKSYIKSEDWEGLGAYIASGINAGLQKIYDVISWNNVGPRITYFVTAFTQTFNSLVAHIDWDLMGRTIGAGINTIVNTLNLLIEGIDWINLGKSFAVGVMGIVSEVNWVNLGNLIGNKFMIAWKTFYGFVTNLDYAEIGLALADAINGAVKKIDLGLIMESLSTFVVGLLEALSIAIQNTDWTAVGQQIANALRAIDWLGIASGLFDVGLQLISGLLEAFGELPLPVQLAAAAIGAFFAAFKVVSVISGVIASIKGIIAILTGGGGLVVAIAAIIAIGTLLIANWDAISEKAAEVWSFVKQKFQEFDTWLQSVFTHDWTKEFGIIGGETLNAFFKNVSNIWNSIKQIFNGITTFIGGLFAGNWRQAWEGILQIIKGIWNGIVLVVKSPINDVIGLINGMIRAIVSGLNSAIRAFNRIKIPSWVPGIGGKGINISTISVPKIPYLAQGTVVPPNREFMAVLGDNKREPEVVSPLSTIRQALREEAMSLGLSGAGGNGNLTLKVYLEDDQLINPKKLFEAVITEGKVQQMSTGKNRLLLEN